MSMTQVDRGAVSRSTDGAFTEDEARAVIELNRKQMKRLRDSHELYKYYVDDDAFGGRGGVGDTVYNLYMETLITDCVFTLERYGTSIRYTCYGPYQLDWGGRIE